MAPPSAPSLRRARLLVATCLGLATTIAVATGPSPTSAGTTSVTAIDISAGGNHTCAVVDPGHVYCWGASDRGQLGIGEVDAPVRAPARVQLPTGRIATSVAAGRNHSCALLEPGEVWCWGSNESGQVGTGDLDDIEPHPASVWIPDVPEHSVTQITAGGEHTCAIADERAYCWGSNSSMQAVPVGSSSSRPLPEQVFFETGDEVVTNIAAGGEHTCAIVEDAHLWCWGSDEFGQLGAIDEDSAILRRVSSLVGVTAVALGSEHTCAIDGDADLFCWGAGYLGQVGPLGDDGSSGSNADNPTPLLVGWSGQTGAEFVALGDFHSCAGDPDKRVFCWGWGESGQFGSGSNPLQGVKDPVEVALPADVVLAGGLAKLTAGESHTCAITADARLLCWGDNWSGQVASDEPGQFVLMPSVVVETPDTPGRPDAINDGGTVVLDWDVPTAGGFSAIEGYRIESSTDGATWSLEVVNTGNPTTVALISNLELGVEVRFRVAAINDAGRGPFSLSSDPVVPTTRPDAPAGVLAVAGDTTIEVSWTAPDDGGAPIQTYRVGFTTADAASCDTTDPGLTTTAASLTIESLANDVAHWVCVDATNAVGTSDTATAGPVTPSVPAPDAETEPEPEPDPDPVEPDPTPPGPTDFVPLEPARLLDTRVPGSGTTDGLFAATGPLPGGQEIALQVTGRGGVSDDADAVVLNVTVNEPQNFGFVTAYPCGTERPNASNLNYTPGQTIPNNVIVKVGDGGTVCLYSDQTTNLIADVNGYLPDGPNFVALAPARLLDTRAPGGSTVDGEFASTLKLPGGDEIELQVAGRGGVPDDADAVVLNVTVNDPEGFGFATIYPCGTGRPNASNLNYTPGDTIPNNVVVTLGDGGTVCLFSDQTTNLIADVNGYVPAGSTYRSLVPARLLDTRPTGETIDGEAAGGGALPGGEEVVLRVAGRGGVPDDATAAVLNVTVNDPANFGFVTVYPCETERPNASNLNYEPELTIPNNVIVKLGANGTVCLYSDQTTHLIADVNGAF